MMKITNSYEKLEFEIQKTSIRQRKKIDLRVSIAEYKVDIRKEC